MLLRLLRSICIKVARIEAKHVLDSLHIYQLPYKCISHKIHIHNKATDFAYHKCSMIT